MNKYPSLEQQIIIAHILGKSREFVVAHPKLKLTKRQQKIYEKMTKRLETGEPLAYVTGHKEFYGLDFEVNKNILIPRPETELLVEETLNLLRHNFSKNLVIDVGTGSGCIIISLVKNLLAGKNQVSNWSPSFQNINFIATDKSKRALSVAQKNAQKHGVKKQIRFIQSNLLSFLFKKKMPQFSNPNSQICVIANLPYLSEKIYSQTEKSVKNFEPKLALLSGKDGLDHYRKIFEQINELRQKKLPAKWTVFFEISPEQKKIIEKEFPKKFNLQQMSFQKDLAGKWRIGIAKLGN